MTSYLVTMDDGHKITVDSHSASDAIQSALAKHIGHKVVACRSGAMSEARYRGEINYEVPSHDALAEAPAKRTRIKADDTTTMFDAEEIRKESEYARAQKELDEERETRAGFRAVDYTGEKCKNCGRNRVMNCVNGKRVCEKCAWDADENQYSLHYRAD